MKKKKIFSSAMAAVMALSSIPVAAYSETYASSAEAFVKTKADLQTYFDSFADFVDNELNDYGSVSAKEFKKAYDFCSNVLADKYAITDDYTVAYYMLRSACANLVIYNSSDLQSLIDSCKSIYETQNIYNEEIGDCIYTEEGFAYFCSAYETAVNNINAESRVITDTYEVLYAARKQLVALGAVTKAQFREALKEYENLIAMLPTGYDSWRRGQFTNDWLVLYTNNYWAVLPGLYPYPYVTYDTVCDILSGSGSVNMGWWGATLIPGAQDLSFGYQDISYSASVEDFIYEQYKKLNSMTTINRTTDQEIYQAYMACVDAVSLYSQWIADNIENKTQEDVDALLSGYHNKLVVKYCSDKISELYSALFPDQEQPVISDNSLTAPADSTAEIDGVTVSVKKGEDILKYITVKSDDVILIDVPTTLDNNLQAFLAIYENYSDGVYEDSGIRTLDETNALPSTLSGSDSEWTLIYRSLYYVLNDMFPVTVTEEFSLEDIKSLIDASYELTEVTGDSAFFSKAHDDLVDARREALAWYNAALNTNDYYDNMVINGYTATEIYNILRESYTSLEYQYSDNKYSFGEIYDTISATYSRLESGELAATDILMKALDNTVYGLLTLEASYIEDHSPFTEDMQFIPYNRLYTDSINGNYYEKQLNNAYTSLLVAASMGRPGDADENGVIDARDARAILRGIMGMGEAVSLYLGDVNGDGVVSAIDASEILKGITAGTFSSGWQDYSSYPEIFGEDAAIEAVVSGNPYFGEEITVEYVAREDIDGAIQFKTEADGLTLNSVLANTTSSMSTINGNSIVYAAATPDKFAAGTVLLVAEYTVSGTDSDICLSLFAGKGSEDCSFRKTEPIKVRAVSGIKAVAEGENVTLFWEASNGASQYKVERYNEKNGEWDLVGYSDSNSFIDTELESGTEYTYRVFAQVNGIWSENSDEVKVTTDDLPLSVPVISSISTKEGNVVLSWNTVKNATSYRVYRADSATGKKTLLKAVSTTSYTDTTVTAGKTYYYFVAAYNSNKSELSGYSAAKSVTASAAVEAPMITSLTSGANCANLKWSAVDGATSYRIYRRDPNGTGTGKLIKTVSGTSYTDLNLTAGKVYTYFIRAYNGNISQISGFSSGRAICICSVAAPSNFTVKSGSNKVSLSWDKVDGATSYRVYRAESQTGTKVEIKKLTGTSFTDTDVKAGKTYFYYLRAYNGTTGKISGYSSGKAICVSSIDIPKMTSISSKDKNVTIKWGAVDGATSYRVYRSKTPNSGISLVKAVNSTTFTLTDTVPANGTYYYYVKAYNGNNGSLSSYSDYLTVKIG